MVVDDLEIGKIYTCGGEPVYKLVDIGVDWVLVIHYSTVHYVADPEFFKMEEFLEDFELDDGDYLEYVVNNELVFSDWQTLHHNEKD